MLRLTNIYDNLMKKINIRNPNNIISYSIIAFIIVIIELVAIAVLRVVLHYFYSHRDDFVR